LTNDLKRFVMEIPNVAIAERKKALIINIFAKDKLTK